MGTARVSCLKAWCDWVGDYSTRVVDLVCSIDLVSKNNLCGLMLAGLIGLSSDFLFVS